MSRKLYRLSLTGHELLGLRTHGIRGVWWASSWVWRSTRRAHTSSSTRWSPRRWTTYRRSWTLTTASSAGARRSWHVNCSAATSTSRRPTACRTSTSRFKTSPSRAPRRRYTASSRCVQTARRDGTGRDGTGRDGTGRDGTGLAPVTITIRSWYHCPLSSVHSLCSSYCRLLMLLFWKFLLFLESPLCVIIIDYHSWV